MTKQELIKAFEVLGKIMVQLGSEQDWKDYSTGITEAEFNQFQITINKQFQYNGWFTKESVRKSLINLGALLTTEKLEEWLKDYSYAEKPKRVAIIMAGNIPLVGFHDFLSVILSGNIAVCKLSSDDKHLLPALLGLFVKIEPRVSTLFEISFGKLENLDAVIATGSNNSAQYFEKYFGKYPNIIRKGRTSVAVIDGNETEEELERIGDDIFTYFGMGCRNVTQLLVPENYDLNRFFGAIVGHNDIVNHHKYANNYDYYKAIYLMNQEDLLENGFLLTKESNELFSPIAVLYWHRYKNEEELNNYLEDRKEQIQAIVGSNYIPFGKAQSPGLADYADGVDTMKFLNSLN